MAAPDIVLTRIDNRLLHGQVGISWTAKLHPNLIIIADDIVACDEMQKQIMLSGKHHLLSISSL